VDRIKVKNCKLIELPVMQDNRGGCLSVAEGFRDIPFEIKRVYYIYNLSTKSVIRGMHAHKKLQQAIFCINGSCCLELDDGASSQSVVLNEPNIGIYMDIEVWHAVKDFSENCILIVFASDYYDKFDYIESYSQFIEYLDGHK